MSRNRGAVIDIDRLMNSGLRDIKPYVGGKHKEEAKEKYRIEEPVKMSSNENPLGVSPRALEEAQGMMPGANVYPEGSNRLLREAIAGMHDISPEAVMFGNGADEIIYYLAMGLINDGDEVIILEAMKMELPIVAEASGAVKEIKCAQGDAVEADAVLLVLE